MPTPQHGIDYVPENTTNPAAGLNSALNQIEGRIMPYVLAFVTEAGLPASAADGDTYVLTDSSNANYLARYQAEGDTWVYTAPELVKLLFSEQDEALFYWGGSPLQWTQVP